MVCLQGADIAAASRDPAALDASTHFGALFDVDQGQMPRIPIRLDLMSKPSNFKVAFSIMPLNLLQCAP